VVIVRMWSSTAPLLWAPSSSAPSSNLLSAAGREVCKARRRLGRMELWGLQSGAFFFHVFSNLGRRFNINSNLLHFINLYLFFIHVEMFSSIIWM
jgi:hypothetical protein